DSVLDEAADRYGPLPDSLLNLADYGRIRVMADRLRIESIDREGRTVVMKFRPQARLDPARLVNLMQQRSGLTLIPPAGLKLDLSRAESWKAEGSATRAEGRRTRGSSRSQAAPPSWWTARAREGE